MRRAAHPARKSPWTASRHADTKPLSLTVARNRAANAARRQPFWRATAPNSRDTTTSSRSRTSDRVLSAVIVADLAGNERRLEADCLLPFFGLATQLGPLAQWDLAFDDNRIAVSPASCASSRPGIFAIGDIATYPGKLKLILSGFAEAALAAHAIHPLLHPGEALHFEYSTTKGVPGG